MEKGNVFDSLWCEKYRPTKLTDMVLSLKNRKFFENVRKTKDIPHLLFGGANGVGKTTLAKIIANELLDCQYIYINASDESGIDTVRGKIKAFAQTKSLDGKLKVVILDEIDGLSTVKGGGGSSAQQALRNVIEQYADNTRFIATCNYLSLVIAPLKSRFQLFDLTPPFKDTVARVVSIIKQEGVDVGDDVKDRLEELIKKKYPDIRATIGEIQKNTIDGKLLLTGDVKGGEFVTELFEKIQKKESTRNIREFLIKNEIHFNNDYQEFLVDLFNCIYESDIDETSKRKSMLVVSNYLYQHQFVVDKEINCFSCLLELI